MKPMVILAIVIGIVILLAGAYYFALALCHAAANGDRMLRSCACPKGGLDLDCPIHSEITK